MNTPGKHLKHSSVQAFTLIEVLVASAVMVILVGIVAYIAGSVMNSWNRASGKLSANAEARFVLDIIARDLETTVLRNNGQQWLRVDSKTEPSAALAGNAPYDTNQSDSVTLKLFAPALDRQNGDGVCAIAYQLQYKESYNGGPDTYALYRMVENPQRTLKLYLSSGFDDPTTSNQGNLLMKTVSDGTGNFVIWNQSQANGITSNANYLASNIVSFKIILYDASSDPRPVNADPSSNAINAGYYAFGGVSASGNPESADTLLYADIILTVVTDQGMDLLNNIEQSLVPDDPGDVVTQHGETLVRRVYFQPNPI